MEGGGGGLTLLDSTYLSLSLSLSSEWVREAMERLRVLSLERFLTSTQRLDLLSLRICPS